MTSICRKCGATNDGTITGLNPCHLRNPPQDHKFTGNYGATTGFESDDDDEPLEKEKFKRRKLVCNLIKVENFSKHVSDCTNNLILDKLDHKFVDLDRAAQDCLNIVESQLPLQTTHSFRVPPLALMRFARGGKTLTLSKLFDQLKEAGASPVLLSFNGSGPTAFKRRIGETQAQSILRLIAAQLGEYSPEEALNLLVDRHALDRHLGNNKVVLLLDELNNLGVPLDTDAAELLREMFLDQGGRFLVFTCHFPVTIEANLLQASDFLGKIPSIPASLRGVSTVNMSLARSLKDLRDMSTACEALTEERAAWLAYIPSLVYVCMSDSGKYGVVTPSMRFTQMNITVDPSYERDVLQRFVKELLSGHRDVVVARYYGAFASVGANSLVSYPLCYVKEILAQLNVNEAIVTVLGILGKLEANLNAKHSGLAWECTVQVAIVLRMLEAHWFGGQGPFNLVPEGINPNLAFRTLPDECVTLEDAKNRMDNIVKDYNSPTLIYIASANARYPQVEGFVAYTSGSSVGVKIVGFQMKTADVKPRSDMNTSIINGGGVLIRGRASAKTPRAPKMGWKYMTSKEVRDFLGNSLLLAMPRDWLLDP